jgi:hypothetical protein
MKCAIAMTQRKSSQLFVALSLTTAVAAITLASTAVASAQVGFEVLHAFTGGTTDGAQPAATLI